jgi:hypothetical protein
MRQLEHALAPGSDEPTTTIEHDDRVARRGPVDHIEIAGAIAGHS